jgi:predicted transposase YbfD/YdcC
MNIVDQLASKMKIKAEDVFRKALHGQGQRVESIIRDYKAHGTIPLEVERYVEKELAAWRV